MINRFDANKRRGNDLHAWRLEDPGRTMEYGGDTRYWKYSSVNGWVVCDRGTSSSSCPRCGGALYRVPRRLIDRLFSFRRHRFQCPSRTCGWEGNLPIER